MRIFLGIALAAILAGCSEGGPNGGLVDDAIQDDALSRAEQIDLDYTRLKAVYDAGEVWSCQTVRLTSQNTDGIREYLGNKAWAFSYNPESSHFIGYSNNGITYHSNPWENVRETEYDQMRRNNYYQFWWQVGFEPYNIWFRNTPRFEFRMTSDKTMLAILISSTSGFDSDVYCGAVDYSLATVSGVLVSTL